MIELTLNVSVALTLAGLGYMAYRFVKTTKEIDDSNAAREYAKLYRVYSSTGDLMFYGEEPMARVIHKSHPESILKGSPSLTGIA